MRRSAFVPFAALVLAGCPETGTQEPAADSELGSYALVSVNHAPLPGIVSAADVDTTAILSGHLELRDDRTYESTSEVYRSLAGQRYTLLLVESNGYSRDGSMIRFSMSGDPAPAPDVVGSYEDGVITIEVEAHMRFEREETER